MPNFGKFEIVEKLGEGGMGVVYKAYDPLMQRHVAIKTISREVSADGRIRDRFVREARAVARLEQHKNIVTVYELFEEAGQIYMVMELLNGNSLEEVIDSRRRLSLEEKLRIVLEACDGLAYAHDNAIIHRDVKPGNVYLTKNRGVKVLDFGLAHFAASATKSHLRAVGTPCYMSPEQWLGEEVDARTDIFSLGVLCYELMAEQRPFFSENLAALGYQVLNNDPAPVSELNPAIPAALSETIARAMSKKRNRRYATVRELARDLDRVRSDVQGAAQGLLDQACKMVDELEGLVAPQRELFRPGLLESILDASGRTPVDAALTERTRGDGTQIITNAGQSVGYLELLNEVDLVQSQISRVKELLPRLERADSVLKSATAEEAAGNPEGALRMASALLVELPAWSEAAELLNRVRDKVGPETGAESAAVEEAVTDEGEPRTVESAVSESTPPAESPSGVVDGDLRSARSVETRDPEPLAAPERLLASSPSAESRDLHPPLEAAGDEAAALVKEAVEEGSEQTIARTPVVHAPEDPRKRQQRIAALIAEARARMEADQLILTSVERLEGGDEPEEAFLVRQRVTGALDSRREPEKGTMRRSPVRAEGERERTVRLKQASVPDARSFHPLAGEVRRWFDAVKLYLSRLTSEW